MQTDLNNPLPSAPSTFPSKAGDAGNLGISVIIPAYNARATLEMTLRSVVQQTHPTWEALIIDDGSTDGTHALAESWAGRDRRFRVFRQQNSGVSAARNRGLQEAQYPFVLFLDSDDTIAATYLERAAAKLAADPTLDAVHCGWQRLLPSGATGPAHLGADEPDLFKYFAFQCWFTVHACIVRRDLARAVGGFDSSLVTCEDWDFYQRVTRVGARFGRVPEVMAFYHVRPNSASWDTRRCVSDARVVLGRGHGPDPRLPGAVGKHAKGRTSAHRDVALYCFIAAFAAQDIGAGRDGLDLLDADDLPAAAPGLRPEDVAETIFEMLPMAAARPETEWLHLWESVKDRLTAFLTKLENKTNAPVLAFATMRQLERKILLVDPSQGPLSLGSAYRVDVALEKPICDVFVPPCADRLVCRLLLRGEPIGDAGIPAAGVVTGRQIAEGALEGRKRRLLRGALTPGRALRLTSRIARSLLRRRTLRLLYNLAAPGPNGRSDAVSRLKHEVFRAIETNLLVVLTAPPSLASRRLRRQWQEHLEKIAVCARARARKQAGALRNADKWDQFFALPDPWGYESEYEAVKYAQTLAFVPDRAIIGDALEIGCAEGHFTARLAPRVGRLTAVDVSGRALARAAERCAGHGNISFQKLDLDTDPIPGPSDLIVCSEVLYYVRDLAAVTSRILAQVRPGGFFLTAHPRLLMDDPEGIGFDWDSPFGVETIARTIAAQPGFALCRELRAPLYRILLYQRLLPGQQPGTPETVEVSTVGRMTPAAEASAKWAGRRLPAPASGATNAVPILMYHRIAADGPVALERYRVAPDLFTGQVAALHRAGYRTVTLHNWVDALRRHERLPGKPIILTFDDGYRDFLTTAMPVLRDHGFSATVFLVAERIGQTSDWDAAYGQPSPLLSWGEIHALHEAGIEFGCHSALHRPMTGMDLHELAEDTVRARAILEEGLATPVTTLAYPYGAENEFVRRLTADLGFSAAVTCSPGVSRLGDDLMQLSRIEVVGGCSPEALLASIEENSKAGCVR